ncbi:AbrB family transcriptional regulator [Halobacillus locisalis]|uniref:AbrB family transcriptional regulator n=1 Tax=Halobacillus locisalis TaxID=220753 RepID=UPI001C6835D4|nr:AbrB family transcriptional regulator [Halobacillus locisalis]
MLSYVWSYGIALLSGWAFSLIHIPLAWILGPVTGLFLYKALLRGRTSQSYQARNVAFLLLGVQIGLTFTVETFSLVGPYFIPYTGLSMVMIIVSLGLAYGIARHTSIDETTSLIGAAPGGLSAMIAVSESLKANTVLVTIFHTIRLLAVLFIVPFIVSRWFSVPAQTYVDEASVNGPVWTLFLYVVLFWISYRLRNVVPAALVILPMLIIGGLQANGVAIFELPALFFIASQVVIGVHLGHSVSISDLKKAGKFCGYYFLLAVIIISVGIVSGMALSHWTGMDRVTAMLALAPGGLIEMAITAQETGGQPSVVSSLQTIRLLTIVLLLPLLFKWGLPKLR